MKNNKTVKPVEKPHSIKLRGVSSSTRFGALVIGDVHSGSTMSPMPEGMAFESKDGQVIEPNETQQRLNTIFKETTQEGMEHLEGYRWHLFLMGDQIEGVHHGGQQIVTDEKKEHKQIFMSLIEPIAEACKSSGGKIIVIRGTACHDGSTAEDIGKELKAQKDTVTGRHAFERVQVMLGKVRVDLAHHQPTTSRTHLEAGRMSILLANLTANCARDGYPVPQVVVRAHAHTAGVFGNGAQKYLSNPSYQDHTRHCYKVVTDASHRYGCSTIREVEGKSLPWIELHTRTVQAFRTVEL